MSPKYVFPIREVSPGMTLRDYFAAHAMQAIIAGCITGQKHEDRSWLEADLWAPDVSYQIADAMLRAREQA